MHNTYEEKAKEFGWESPNECQNFEGLPEDNQKVMIAVAKEVIDFFKDVTFEDKDKPETKCEHDYAFTEKDSNKGEGLYIFHCRKCLDLQLKEAKFPI